MSTPSALRSITILFVLVSLYAGLTRPVCGDTIVLKNGNVLEGEVIAENKKFVVIRMPSGIASFPRRHVKSIKRRKRPSDGVRPAPGSETTREEALTPRISAVYLRDGRQVPGRASEEIGERVSVRTPYGAVSFSKWLLDSGGEIEQAWSFATELTDPNDEVLLAELERRHGAVLVRQRGLDKGLRKKIDSATNELRQLLVARNVGELVNFSRRMYQMQAQFPAHERGRIRDLSGKALKSAIEISLGERRRIPPQKLVRMYFELHRTTYSAEYREIGRFEMKKTIDPLFSTDPIRWSRPLGLLDSVEGHDWWSEFEISQSDGWRRTTADAEWFEGSPLPKLYRVVRPGGDPMFLAEPPVSPDGVSSVWNPTVDKKEDGSSSDPYWYRVFWCPLEQQWKRETVTEDIAACIRSIATYIGAQIRRERIDTGEVGFRLKEYNRILDDVALNRFDPRKKALRRYYEPHFERANEVLGKLFEVNSRTLRRRLHYWPIYLKLRKLQDLLLQIERGVPVDLAPFAVAPAVTDVPDETTVGEVEKPILAVLTNWDIHARVATLRGAPIREMRASKEVAACVQELAANDLTLPEVRQAAQELLATWRSEEKAEKKAAEAE